MKHSIVHPIYFVLLRFFAVLLALTIIFYLLNIIIFNIISSVYPLIEVIPKPKQPPQSSPNSPKFYGNKLDISELNPKNNLFSRARSNSPFAEDSDYDYDYDSETQDNFNPSFVVPKEFYSNLNNSSQYLRRDSFSQ
ncbi:uncharacterized protein RJT21DRAFT_4740 [Scheffersomyces amazonensis]|uniref:uncharacterized protein n=1 Tax=Scheffersomyces amazonensis TaxID=1078765 RepID=UPI00315DBBAE